MTVKASKQSACVLVVANSNYEGVIGNICHSQLRNYGCGYFIQNSFTLCHTNKERVVCGDCGWVHTASANGYAKVSETSGRENRLVLHSGHVKMNLEVATGIKISHSALVQNDLSSSVHIRQTHAQEPSATNAVVRALCDTTCCGHCACTSGTYPHADREFRKPISHRGSEVATGACGHQHCGREGSSRNKVVTTETGSDTIR